MEVHASSKHLTRSDFYLYEFHDTCNMVLFFFRRKNVTNHYVRVKKNSVCLQRTVLNRQNATQLKVLLVPVVSHRAWQAFLVAQMIKNPSAMPGPRFKSLGWEDPLEKGMAGYPLQYSFLENSIGRGTLWATVLGVTNNWTGLWD